MRSWVKSIIETLENASGVNSLIIANILAILVCIIISRGYEDQEEWERRTVIIVISGTAIGTVYNVLLFGGVL